MSLWMKMRSFPVTLTIVSVVVTGSVSAIANGGRELHFIYAKYGREGNFPLLACHHQDVPRIWEKCEGKSFCQFDVTNEWMQIGDPCPQVPKELLLRYVCTDNSGYSKEFSSAHGEGRTNERINCYQ